MDNKQKKITKDEVKKLVVLWEGHTLEEIARMMDKPEKYLSRVAYKLRTLGIPLSKKFNRKPVKRSSQMQEAVAEILAEELKIQGR